MHHANYFEDLFESIPDYREIVLSLSLNEKDEKFVNEREFWKNDFKRLHEEVRSIIKE